MAKLSISNISIKVKAKKIIDDLSLEIKSGEIHALMGPNGAGKSSLAQILAGNDHYQITGEIILDQQNILDLKPEKRAHLGLLLAFQNPVEIPGLKIELFLREAYRQRFPEREISALEFRQKLQALAQELKIDEQLIFRNLNENFSGGEKKKLEILQLAILEPKFLIIDEIDSGLDIDALKNIAQAIKLIISRYNTGLLIITHYQRLLNYLTPDFVHILSAGKIVKSGDLTLVEKLEKTGYENLM